jgi:hypothetical protein
VPRADCSSLAAGLDSTSCSAGAELLPLSTMIAFSSASRLGMLLGSNCVRMRCDNCVRGVRPLTAYTVIIWEAQCVSQKRHKIGICGTRNQNRGPLHSIFLAYIEKRLIMIATASYFSHYRWENPLEKGILSTDN